MYKSMKVKGGLINLVNYLSTDIKSKEHHFIIILISENPLWGSGNKVCMYVCIFIQGYYKNRLGFSQDTLNWKVPDIHLTCMKGDKYIERGHSTGSPC